MGWGSAAWKVKSRDTFIGWDAKTRENNLRFVANNTRFLILPWVSVKCLASKLLALNARRISDDWLQTYNYPLYLLETFVEKDRFKVYPVKFPKGHDEKVSHETTTSDAINILFFTKFDPI